MVRFELKKILSKPVSKTALILLAAILCIVSYIAVRNVRYVDENGDTIRGIPAARALREAKMQWSGYVTAEELARVVEENARINRSDEYLSNDVRENEKAYSKKQGFSDLRDMINRAFCGFRQYDYYRIDSLTKEDVSLFYERRIAALTEWLYSDEAVNHFSEGEKSYLIRQYRKLETPVYYEYFEGWEAALQDAPMIIMLTVLITGFLVCGIFSDEMQFKADSVFFSTKFGRSRAVAAKIGAGVIMITAVYWTTLLLYSGIVLTALGADGAGCAIQIGASNWKSFYNLTYFQDYSLTILGGYIGNLFLLTLSMLASAKMRSGIFAVTIPFIFLFLPEFLRGIPALSGILGLLPDQLLQLCAAVRLFNTYQIGNKVTGAVPVLMAAYSLLCLILFPVLYRAYRKTEIR